jgi:protein gp37
MDANDQYRALPNLWLGISVVNQEEADRDIPKLLRVPAAVRFLSMEPLLGPVEFSNVSRRADAISQLGKKALLGIDWVIVGGESGRGARPMHPDWARSLRDQCAAAGTPFFFKQWGEWAPADAISDDEDRKLEERWLSVSGRSLDPSEGVDIFKGDEVVYRAGKKAAGRTLDGRTHDEFPEAKS